MSAADASLEATGGSLELRIVKRRTEVCEDDTLRLDPDGTPRALVQLVLMSNELMSGPYAMVVLDAQDCRQLAAQLTTLARQLKELA